MASAEIDAWFIRPIEIRILRVEGSQVRVGIDAVTALRITRTEARRDGSLSIRK